MYSSSKMMEELHALQEDQTPNFPSSWSSILLDPKVPTLLFKLYGLVSDENSVRMIQKCLIQYCGLRRPLFANDSDRVKYLNDLIDGLTVIFENFVYTSDSVGFADSDVDWKYENYGEICTTFCQMSERLVKTAPLSSLTLAKQFPSFLNCLCRLTCDILEKSAKRDDDNVDNWWMRAFNHLLHMWTHVGKHRAPLPIA